MDRGLLLEGRRNLLEYFQAAGYFDASVDFEQHDEITGQTVIDYAITRGTRSKLISIEIHGNHFFDKPTLMERLGIRVASVIRYRHGRFSQRLLERDLDVIRDLYRSNGFRDVVATGQISESFKGKPGDLGVDYRNHGRTAMAGQQPGAYRYPGRGSRHADGDAGIHTGPGLQRIQRGQRPRRRAELLLQQRLSRRHLRLDPTGREESSRGRPALCG